MSVAANGSGELAGNGNATEANEEQAASQELVEDTPPQMSQDSDLYVRLMGLPYKADEQAVRDWLGGLSVVSVKLLADIDPRLAVKGEAYVQCATAEDAKEALKKNREYLQNRYIEVFSVPPSELSVFLKRLDEKQTAENKGYLRLGGLPFNATGKTSRSYSLEDVIFGRDVGGKPWSGFVKFSSREEAEKAMELNGKHMGKRWVDLTMSDIVSYTKYKQRLDRPAPGLLDQPASYRPPHPLHYGGPMPPPAPRGYGYDPYDGGYAQGYGGGPAPRGRPGHGGGPAHARYAPYGPPAGGLRSLAAAPAPYHDQYGSYGGGGYDAGPPATPAPYGGRPYDAYSAQPPAPDYGQAGGDSENVGPTKVFMRGLPFRVSAQEVEQFFAPIVCVDVKFGVRQDGRASGDGVVVFRTAGEARKALEKDRSSIQNRYVELYPTTQMPPPRNTSYYSAIQDDSDYGTQAPPVPAAYNAPTDYGASYASAAGTGYTPQASYGPASAPQNSYAPPSGYAPQDTYSAPQQPPGGPRYGGKPGRQAQPPPPPPGQPAPPAQEYSSYPSYSAADASYGYGYGY
ncbi:RNA binding protein [Aphelenchoides avenae]|nr:RNA binding protein [Aphelenchus avenae]